MNAARKIQFPLRPDEEGPPGVTEESLAVADLGDGEYEVLDIPFFVQSVAVADVVTAVEYEGGLRYAETLRDAGHSTMRVLVYDLTLLPSCRKGLADLGCRTAHGASDGLLAVDVPPEANLNAVRDYLDRGEDSTLWFCEESCIRRPGGSANAGRPSRFQGD